MDSNYITDLKKATKGSSPLTIIGVAYSEVTKQLTLSRLNGSSFDVNLESLQDILLVVATYAELPDATANIGELAVVTTTTGIIGLTRKQSGLYFSNGATWDRLDVNYNAEQTYYNNTNGNLTALNVKTALDELSLTVASLSNGISLPTTTKTIDYSVVNTDYTIRVDCTNNDVNITLPTAQVGKIFIIKRIDNSNFNCNIIGTIDNTVNIQIKLQNQSLTLQYNGTDWDII